MEKPSDSFCFRLSSAFIRGLTFSPFACLTQNEGRHRTHCGPFPCLAGPEHTAHLASGRVDPFAHTPRVALLFLLPHRLSADDAPRTGKTPAADLQGEKRR